MSDFIFCQTEECLQNTAFANLTKGPGDFLTYFSAIMIYKSGNIRDKT